MPLFDIFSEDVRAADAAVHTGRLGPDNRFYQDLGFAFQLHTPSGKQLFTLVINPERYEKTFPYAKTNHFGQSGGVAIERQGIIVSKIVIAGHTGVGPRAVAGVDIPLSGQAHFVRLEEECFLRFDKLVKDPTIADRVFMTFHNFRDNEHFVVEPDSWKLSQTKERRLHYPYEISLDVYGPAEALVVKGDEDDAVLREIQDASLQIGRAVAKIEAALSDIPLGDTTVGAAFKETQVALSLATQGASLINEATGSLRLIAGAASEFVRGARTAIGLPRRTILDTMRGLDDLVDVLSQAANFPADVVQSYRSTIDALETLAAYPEKFVEPFPAAADRFLDLARGPSSEDPADLDTAANTSAEALTYGTGPTPGDEQRVAAGLFDLAGTIPSYQGFREYVVAFNDTLPGIAAAQLNDARRWIDIALANNLRSPFISTAGLEGTVFPGDRILIPTLEAGPVTAVVRSGGDPDLGASQYEALLGRDYKLVDVDGGALDYEVDVAGGAIDFVQIAGVDLVGQAVRIILGTIRGTNILFTQLGVARLVGRPGTFDRLFEGQLSVSDGLLRDPRIDRVRSMHFIAEGDRIVTDIDVELIRDIQYRTIARVNT